MSCQENNVRYCNLDSGNVGNKMNYTFYTKKLHRS